MRLVIGLGGNALLPRGDPLDMSIQRHNAAHAAVPIAELARHHHVIVTHGNGPQVGYLAMLSGNDANTPVTPLDVLDAESAGMIGYLLEQELNNAAPDLDVVSVLTRVVVDRADPAFAHPTKPIGPRFDGAEAARRRESHQWTMVADGEQWRRVVPSPEPQSIVELRAISLLSSAGLLVICDGGGGIPIAIEAGMMIGVEAVIDKDLSTALLAQLLPADALLLLTDVEAVFADYATPRQRAIRAATPSMLRTMTFAPGSMGPKVDAACRFVEAGGSFASIGRLDDAARLLAGTAGTQISVDAAPIAYY